MLMLALALAVAGDARPAGPQLAAEPAARQCTQVAIEALRSPSVQAAPASPRSESAQFSASGTLDLAFSVRLAGPAVGQPIQFRLYTPKGHLYQELRGPDAANREHTVAVRLPVAGTDIVNHSLYGTWTVAAHVNGAAQPCSQVRTFSLTP